MLKGGLLFNPCPWIILSERGPVNYLFHHQGSFAMKAKPPSFVSWDPGSPFVEWFLDEAAGVSKRLRFRGDRHEALLEVWAGLKCRFSEGQPLLETDIKLMRIITNRRTLTYLKNQGSRRPKQPGRSLLDDPEVEDVKAPGDPPDQLAANREIIGMIESELSRMPTYRAEAVRSRFGYPESPAWDELIRTSGTTRQNVEKHAKKGLEELKLKFISAA